MVEKRDEIRNKILDFFEIIRKLYPVKTVILYGSFSRGSEKPESDIDVGIVIDLPDHNNRIEITADLFHHAFRIDPRIEPKCIFWDEYQNHDPASILGEIIRSGIRIA